MLLALRDLHTNFVWLHEPAKAALSGRSREQLDWVPPAEDANSVAQLVAHIAYAERYWIGEVVGGEAVGEERDDAFGISGLDAEALGVLLDETLAEAEHVLENVLAADLDGEFTTGPGGPVTVLGPLELTRDLVKAALAQS